MKKYIIIVHLLLVDFIILAQKWDNTYGTSYNNEFIEDVIECYDKGYLISGGNDVWPYPSLMIKTDVNGEVLWEKTIQHLQKDIYKGQIDQNSSGEIIIGSTLWVNSSDNWPMITKLDSCGNKLWCRTYIDDNYFWGAINDVILFDNGDVLALGWLESEEEIDKIFLYYIDSNGNLIWRKSYASKSNHPLVKNRMGNKIQKLNCGYIISGRCHYPYPGNPNVGYIRPFYIGIDSLFNEKWILPFGISDSVYGEAYSVSEISDSLYMGIAVSILSGTELNTILTFFNDDGDELEYSQISNESIGPDVENNITNEIAKMNDTLFITSTSFGPNDLGNSFGELIIDIYGNVYKSESRPNTEGISTLIKTFDNKYVIGCTYEHPNGNEDIYLYKINDSLQMDTLYPGNYTYDSLCPYQIQSGIIDISDCLLITDVGEAPSPQEYYASLQTIPVKAYPNPTAKDRITLEYQNTQHHRNMELRCFNIFGEQVHKETIYPHQGKSIIPISTWHKGIYLGLVYSDGRVAGRVKFVIR